MDLNFVLIINEMIYFKKKVPGFISNSDFGNKRF